MPPISTRVSDETAAVTKTSVFFSFNCSWFSDVNGAVRFFAVVVTESEGAQGRNLTAVTCCSGACLGINMPYVCILKGREDLQPEQRDPLPSYLDYRSNTSVKSYQTGYFPSLCAESPDSSFQLSLGSGMETLGGSCEGRQSARHGMKVYCDGPLKPSTAYRYFTPSSLQPLMLTHILVLCHVKWSCVSVCYSGIVAPIFLLGVQMRGCQ